VKQTLADRQDEMIRVLTQQFAGSVRFKKMDTVEAAFAQYREDADFGLVAAGALDAQGNTILEFGDDRAQTAASLAVAQEALAADALVSRRDGKHHIAAYPAHFGKEGKLAGAVVMNWDLSIHDAEIVG